MKICTGNSAERSDCMLHDDCRCKDVEERIPTGLDAPYYDIPPQVTCIQDAIEYLDLNFALGNILKSIWRQHGSHTKETDALYEAEKRKYFADREYERVRRHHEMERQGQRLRQEAEERMREPGLCPDATEECCMEEPCRMGMCCLSREGFEEIE